MQTENDLLELQRQLALRMADGLNVEATARLGLQIAIQASEMDSGGVYLIENDPRSLVLKTSLGISKEFIEIIYRYLPDSDRWNLVMERKPVFSNYDQLPFQQIPVLTVEGLKSVAILPMLYQDKVIGSLQLASHHEKKISQSQKKVLETISLQLGKHIERARQMEDAQKNELQFRELVDSLEESVLVIFFNGSIQYANRHLLRLLDYSQDQFVGHNLDEFYNSSNNQGFSDFLLHLQDKSSQTMLVFLSARNGELHSLEITATHAMWDYKPALSIFGFEYMRNAKDVSANQPGDVKQLVDLIPAAAIIINAQTFEILHSNTGFQRFFKYSKEAQSAANFLQLFAQNEYMRLITALRIKGLASLGGTQTWTQVKQDGTEIQTTLHIHPIEWGTMSASMVIIDPPEVQDAPRHEISENRYRDVVEQQTDIVVRFTTDGMITFVNQAYCDFLKKLPEQLIGRSLYDFLSFSEVETVREHLAKISIEIPMGESRNYLIDGEGNWRYLNWIDRGIFEGNELVEVQGVGRDVTEQVKESLLIETMQQRYQTLVEELPGVVYVLHAESLRPLYISPLFERVSGYNILDIWEQPGLVINSIFPDDFPKVKETILKRVGGEDLPHQEFRFYHSDGHIMWVQEYGSRIQTQNGVNLLQGLVLDVTETHLARQKIEYYAKFERLINEISLSLMNIRPYQWDSTVDDILRSIGTLLEVDRSYIFCIQADKNTLSNTHEWCATGISSQINNLQKMSITEAEMWFQYFGDENAIMIKDVSALPQEFESTRTLLQTQSIQSLLLVAMMRQNEICGFIGFDTVRMKKEWDDQAILLLRTVSQMLLNTKDRISPQKPTLSI